MKTASNPGARLTVAVAEDHPVVRAGLVNLLRDEGGFAVAGQAGTARELRVLMEKIPVQVLITDLMLGDQDGLALIKDLVALVPTLRVVVFSLHQEDVYAERCLRAGAHGYVMKREPVDLLFRAVREVANGGIFISPRISATLLGRLTGAARKPVGAYAQLTDRELQVFRLIGHEFTSRQIAEKLGVSVKTIEAHRENIKNKLGADSSPALVARAAVWVRENESG
jgi:DNA-binding NarL/FixJ family response regulator